MDRNELKNQALLERVSGLTAEYENKVADLRVELTMLSQELEALKSENAADSEPIEGTVVAD